MHSDLFVGNTDQGEHSAALGEDTALSEEFRLAVLKSRESNDPQLNIRQLGDVPQNIPFVDGASKNFETSEDASNPNRKPFQTQDTVVLDDLVRQNTLRTDADVFAMAMDNVIAGEQSGLSTQQNLIGNDAVTRDDSTASGASGYDASQAGLRLQSILDVQINSEEAPSSETLNASRTAAVTDTQARSTQGTTLAALINDMRMAGTLDPIT